MQQKKEWAKYRKFEEYRCMKRIVPSVIILALPIIIFPMEKALGKMMAEVECKGTEEKLVYDCMIYLTDMKTKKKLDRAKFVVGADMPSMPGAHNVKPVMAHSMGMGMYHVRLNLEMYGEWVLKMDFTKPRRDRIVKKMIFGEKGHELSHDHNGKHEHKKEVMKMSHDHGKNHKHKKGEMPMEHDNRTSD